MPDLAELIFAPLAQGPPAEAHGEEFVAVPGGAPRWFLPAESRAIDPNVTGWSPYRFGSRLRWAAIRAAHRAGCLSALPRAERMNIPQAGAADWRSVGWSSASSPVPLVYVGTPGISRKAVIHLVNPDSEVCEAIVKVPLTEAARAAILGEADVLVVLASENYTFAPRLLHVDRERGVTTQTALIGRAGGRRFHDSYGDRLRSLMLTGEHTAIAGHALEWQEQLERVASNGAGSNTLVAAMSELMDFDVVPAFWVHGDFAPWNIRRMPDGTAALLDWEDAHRGGLPLQDAFHFFHMQDYLFGARPATHCGDVARLAATVGLSAQQRHKLEIAYLTHAYMRRWAVGEIQHCTYLLATLAVALEERPKSLAPAVNFTVINSPNVARSAPTPVSLQSRSDLFNAVIARLNAAEVPYCLLSGHQNHAGNNSSDVDFMFHPRDMHRIAPLLAQVARHGGARLVQAMRHETTACYFVLAKTDSAETGYLDPDCTVDYRAHGRLWFSAEKVLARRRRRENFYVPAVSDEFAYYLIKKVLKQSISECQLRRLRHLYLRHPAGCRAAIERFWPPATMRAMERAFTDSNLAWFQSAMPELLRGLMASAPLEGRWKLIAQKLRDAGRIVERILRPTGMSVLVCGGDKEQRTALVSGLLARLAPAFRRVASAEFRAGGVRSLAPRLRLARSVLKSPMRSTLVVSQVEDSAGKGVQLLAARLLLQPGLIFVLTSDPSQAVPEAGFHAGVAATQVIHLCSELSTDQMAQQASHRALRWLAERLERRLSLRHEYAAGVASSPLMAARPEPASVSEGAK